MSNTLAVVAAAFASELGYKEGRNNTTKYGAWFGPGFQNTAWCDEFVSYCGAKAGAADIIGRFAYCPAHVQWFKMRGQWGLTPRAGAIVFYSWNHDPIADHVGFVERVITSPTSSPAIQTIEGNTSSGVVGSQGNGDGSYRRVRTTRDVLGYGYPAYSSPAANSSIPAVLVSSKPAPAPAGAKRVSLVNLRASIQVDGPKPTGFASNRANTLPVELALAAEGLLPARYADGSAGSTTFGKGSAYQKWQLRCGYHGADADGFPGSASLVQLGRAHGFVVVA